MDLRVKEVCKEKGVTLAEVASKIGVAQASLSKMLGGNPTIGTLEKISNTLNVPIAELFEKPNASNIIGFVMVGDTVHEVKSVEDVKDLAGKL